MWVCVREFEEKSFHQYIFVTAFSMIFNFGRIKREQQLVTTWQIIEHSWDELEFHYISFYDLGQMKCIRLAWGGEVTHNTHDFWHFKNCLLLILTKGKHIVQIVIIVQNGSRTLEEFWNRISHHRCCIVQATFSFNLISKNTMLRRLFFTPNIQFLHFSFSIVNACVFAQTKNKNAKTQYFFPFHK